MILLIIKTKFILLSQVWPGHFSSWDSSTNQCGYYDICGHGSISEMSKSKLLHTCGFDIASSRVVM